MKAVIRATCGILFVLFSGMNTHGQPMPEGQPPPPPEEGRERGKPEKGFREFREKQGRDKEGRMMRFEPFLMAGDPRFQHMLLLAMTPPEQLEEKMKDWPPLAEMSEERKEQMKKEMEGFRNRIVKAALKNAEESGLTLTEQQKPLYVKRYWERRSKVETAIREEIQDRLKLSMEQESAALKKEFSMPAASSR